MNRKLILFLVFILMAIISVTSVSAFWFWDSDIVDVTKISMKVGYTDTPFGGAIYSSHYQDQENMQRLQYLKTAQPEQYELELELSGITDEEVENFEPTELNYRDYQVKTAVTQFSIMPKEDIARVTGLSLENVEVFFENGDKENWGSYDYEPDDFYIRDVNYDFQFTADLNNSAKTIEEYYNVTHIKADIVIDTTDESNKVIGHLDEDIVPEHY